MFLYILFVNIRFRQCISIATFLKVGITYFELNYFLDLNQNEANPERNDRGGWRQHQIRHRLLRGHQGQPHLLPRQQGHQGGGGHHHKGGERRGEPDDWAGRAGTFWPLWVCYEDGGRGGQLPSQVSSHTGINSCRVDSFIFLWDYKNIKGLFNHFTIKL